MMRAADLEPLEPYRGMLFNWKCRCLRCGSEVAPRPSHVQQGGRGCKECARRASSAREKGDPEEAAEILRRAGLEPLAPYPGNKEHWLCFCITCASVLEPRLADIKRGSACPHCAKYGFDPAAPAVLYLLFHESLDAVKIGITGAKSVRIKTFAGRGWSCLKVMDFPDGAGARKVEQAVLAYVREELGFGPHLTRGDMRDTGFTETFPADDLPPLKAWELVLRFAGDARPLENGSSGLAA